MIIGTGIPLDQIGEEQLEKQGAMCLCCACGFAYLYETLPVNLEFGFMAHCGKPMSVWRRDQGRQAAVEAILAMSQAGESVIEQEDHPLKGNTRIELVLQVGAKRYISPELLSQSVLGVQGTKEYYKRELAAEMLGALREVVNGKVLKKL